MKVCFKCKETKPFSEFGIDKQKKSGFTSCCVSCNKESHAKIQLEFIEWRKNNLIKEKECNKCKKIKPVFEFSKGNISRDGFAYTCKACIKLYAEINKKHIKVYMMSWYQDNKEKQKVYYQTNKESLKTNKDKDKHKATCRLWKQDNPMKVRAYTNKRRAAKLKRSPSYANSEVIQEFYINCPEGYHVDHIIPLQGDLVSGLHVLSNLQYLLPKDNYSKNNSYTPQLEVF